MRQQNHKNTFLKTIPFTSIFVEALKQSSMWVSSNYIDGNSQFQGKLLLKVDSQWESVQLNLHPEKLYRKGVGSDDYTSYCQLQACFLKKFTHFDPTMPNYRYGIRLQFGQQLSHLLCENSDVFKKWFQFLRRFCIMDKFARKYKVLGKIKQCDPVFGQCLFSCVRVQDAEYHVVKVIDKNVITAGQKQNLYRELSNLRKLSQTQICYIVEVFEDEQSVYILYEYYLGIDLRTYIKESQIYQMAEQSSQGLDEKLVADILYGVLQAIQHMHSKGVFHRDIKMENLFIPEKKRLPFVVLGNFCYSETTDSTQYKKCGTPGFVAPEIFRSKNYTSKVDLFSLGIIFYLLVYGKLPFEGKDQEEILRSNEKCDIDFKFEKKICKKISISGMDLLKGLLNKEPIKRLSAAQALNHHWFIKMGTRNQRNQYLQVQRGKSLSTIIENSVDITQSYYQSNSQLYQSTKEDDKLDRVEKEFIKGSLYDKLLYFNSIQYQPSKIRRIQQST
ncbi:unnamed protein product (macronuclear) [Paramecium tetraurelia]|uniref:Protein kinase domain-containing protein n=1 Tax=Paramecium tetraurelia TaxID=5888 RepID=A0C2V8_PARTE|nr:uncharacterized protein GSPATT00034603001 [Paramecium tetraurelia]CAK65125.1 unnamed protein product [Paramecium tetraurelia]|eukprot:XP_001432522.1 hypothetical protein (macronuclear) [Paramecium tetraurelia strain d4-2]